MKIEQTSLVDYEDVDTRFLMKLPVLFQRLQRAALYHSASVGLGSETLRAAGGAWILSRMLVEIRRMPRYGETVTLRTWHKGSAGFRAGRDFVVLCDGEMAAAATSQWLYLDLHRQRIAKIPLDVAEPYTTEEEDVLEAGAIDFAVNKGFDPEATVTITTRDGDYDPNGHVNNAVYLDYLDTLIKRTGLVSGDVRRVGIHYLKEVGRQVHTIDGGAARSGNRVDFRLFDRSAVYAAGFVDLPVPASRG